MSADYQAVQWNKFKKLYDASIIIGIVVYVAVFMLVSSLTFNAPQDISPMILMIRALGSCALIMLHVILAIGPLARLLGFFKPLLYNRRHLGVAMFITATAHIILVLIWYHGYGVLSPLYSLFLSNPGYLLEDADYAKFPFEFYGLGAYLILLVMALSSHDFWLKFFGAPMWKLMHMGVYVAYVLLLAHVLFGFIQAENKSYNLVYLGGAAGFIIFLHLLSAFKEWFNDGRNNSRADWVALCPSDSIKNNRAKGFTLSRGDKIAVFRYDDNKLVAVANACAHQNGPLCEGKVINGKIVCPWHGYEYIPTSGRSPAPFTEKIATYQLRVRKGMVEVNQQAKPPGTQVKAATLR